MATKKSSVSTEEKHVLELLHKKQPAHRQDPAPEVVTPAKQRLDGDEARALASTGTFTPVVAQALLDRITVNGKPMYRVSYGPKVNDSYYVPAEVFGSQPPLALELVLRPITKQGK